MNILIDLIHTADVNFYKQAIEQLSKKNTIILTVLNRGRLPEIVAKEYKGYEQIIFGTHYSSFLLKLWTIAIRELRFFWLFLTRKIDVVSSFGFYPGFLAPLFGIKAVHFHDDKEYSFNYKLSRAYASRFISLCPTKETKKTRVVHSFKELAYLNMKEDISILKKLQLEKEKYVYVREVANISLNYKGEQQFNYEKTFEHFRTLDYTILFDGEAKKTNYKNVKLVTPPYSTQQMIAIYKNAALIITSGDTVLREGSLLGVPTIYTSSRVMEVNKPLQEEGLFEVCLDEKSLLETAKKIMKNKKSLQVKAKKVRGKSEDIVKIIVQEVGSK